MKFPVLSVPSEGDFEHYIRFYEGIFRSAIENYKDGESLDPFHVAVRKLNLLKDLRGQYAAAHGRRDTLFISLSGPISPTSAGGAEKLSVLRRVAERHHFSNVITGFDSDVRYIMQDVVTKISISNAFLGVWTNEFARNRKGNSAGSNEPSVWMPLELGIAIAERKHFSLLLEQGISPDSISPVHDIAHRWFGSADFEEQANEAISQLRVAVGGPASV